LIKPFTFNAGLLSLWVGKQRPQASSENEEPVAAHPDFVEGKLEPDAGETQSDFAQPETKQATQDEPEQQAQDDKQANEKAAQREAINISNQDFIRAVFSEIAVGEIYNQSGA
jgi:hypothetical protein